MLPSLFHMYEYNNTPSTRLSSSLRPPTRSAARLHARGPVCGVENTQTRCRVCCYIHRYEIKKASLVSILKSTKTNLASHGRHGQKYRENLKIAFSFLWLTRGRGATWSPPRPATPRNRCAARRRCPTCKKSDRERCLNNMKQASESGRSKNCLASELCPKEKQKFPHHKGSRHVWCLLREGVP